MCLKGQARIRAEASTARRPHADTTGMDMQDRASQSSLILDRPLLLDPAPGFLTKHRAWLLERERSSILKILEQGLTTSLTMAPYRYQATTISAKIGREFRCTAHQLLRSAAFILDAFPWFRALLAVYVDASSSSLFQVQDLQCTTKNTSLGRHVRSDDSFGVIVIVVRSRWRSSRASLRRMRYSFKEAV
jgi:hypothetical protein